MSCFCVKKVIKNKNPLESAGVFQRLTDPCNYFDILKNILILKPMKELIDKRNADKCNKEKIYINLQLMNH